MPGGNYIVFQQMRPPVAIDTNGQSPIRTKKARQVFNSSNQEIKLAQIVHNQTDDGRLKDTKWNHRHHIAPSWFNSQNKSYHQRKIDIALVPKRQLDPYEDNEVKGTRMPDYSKVSLERDVYGELGWIPNFNIKKSKNNIVCHTNYKEFFDKPVDYTGEFLNGQIPDYQTNPQDFKGDSPSVMKTLRSRSPSEKSSVFNVTRRSLNTVERMSYSQLRDHSKTINHLFILQPDHSNRHAISPEVKNTIEIAGSIPFLRSPQNTDNMSWRNHTLSETPTVGKVFAKKSADLHLRKLKEKAWKANAIPISKFNESVHSGQRIPFEKI